MRVNDRDPHTGHLTTGHEWNGIRELNTAVPKSVWYFLVAAVVFSIVYWLLMPAWPTGRAYTKGLLGFDIHQRVSADLRRAAAERTAWTSQINQSDIAAIRANEMLMGKVRQSGRTLFGDNCAVCHGSSAGGGPGFPSLVDKAWLWGGTPEAILETIRVGINADHPDTHSAQMPAFGRDGILDRASVLKVVAYVRSRSPGLEWRGNVAQEIESGKAVFAANCSACHGSDGGGNSDAGAPDLTDAFWIYGGDEESVFRSVYYGRQGHMPSWSERLTETERTILATYILDLSAGAR